MSSSSMSKIRPLPLECTFDGAREDVNIPLSVFKNGASKSGGMDCALKQSADAPPKAFQDKITEWPITGKSRIKVSGY